VFDELDVSEGTRYDYQARIFLFTNFVKSQGELDHNSFLSFKRYLSERNDIGVATKNKYLATARIFLKELNRLGVLPRDITQNVKGFNQGKKHKRDGLSATNVAVMMERLKQLPSTPSNTRLKALLALLVFQGLRQIEIVRLNISDVDLAARGAMVRGKGCDDVEPVDLHPSTVKALADYLSINKIADGPLFTSNSNNGKGQRLTTKSVRVIVGKLFKELKIEGKTVHGCRHFFTTTLIKQFGGNLLDVMQYTRHKSVEMLVVYNDRIRKSEDLPRYYRAFSEIIS
jgi:integrase